jgi:hypothetical protein
VNEWDTYHKQRYIIAVRECGYAHDQVADDPDADMVDIYHMDSLRDLAEAFGHLEKPLPFGVMT